ncbi:hypothetical protein ABPG73_022773 [Tetrahymena malaccensis]
MDQNNSNKQDQQNTLQKLVSHIQNRKKVKQMYKDKGIQMLDKPELLSKQQIISLHYFYTNTSQSSKKYLINGDLRDKQFRMSTPLLDIDNILFIIQIKIVADLVDPEAVIAELKSKVNVLEKANTDLKNQLKKQENETKKQVEIIKELKQSDTILQQKAKAYEMKIEDLQKQLEKKFKENQEFYSQMLNEQDIYKQEKKKLEEIIVEFKQSDFNWKQKINEQEKRIKDLENQLQNNIQKMNIQSMQNPFFNNQQANQKQELAKDPTLVNNFIDKILISINNKNRQQKIFFKLKSCDVIDQTQYSDRL